MPKHGAYSEDVVLTAWLVAEGQSVAAGDALFELETEKTAAEVEAENGGFLHQLVPVGQAVPIGATVGMIAETREEYETLAAAPDGRGAEPAAEPLAAPD